LPNFSTVLCHGQPVIMKKIMKLFWYSALRLSGILAFQKLKNLTSCRTRMESMCQLAAFYRTRPHDCSNWLWFYTHQSLVTGEEHPTVIPLTWPYTRRQCSWWDDLKRTVFPRLGELHTVMAALRALGTSIENSGIDDAWLEAGVYPHKRRHRRWKLSQELKKANTCYILCKVHMCRNGQS